MNSELVDRIAEAVLYEGYVLYPYRPSVKNRQRWTFGGLVPRDYSEIHAGSDPWQMRAECLMRGDAQTLLEVRVRFLHLRARIVWELDAPQAEFDAAKAPLGRRVETLQAGDRLWQTWQEASERTFAPAPWRLGTLAQQPWSGELAYPASLIREPVPAPSGDVIGTIEWEQHALVAKVEVSAQETASGVFKIGVTIENHTPMPDPRTKPRDEAMLHSLVSTHAILGAEGGEFISLFDPPAELAEMARDCRNVGAWPVLAGNPGERNTMLASSIILYDYPQIAAESPGDLFDGTEIDEILTLRIQTLTDDEKKQAAAVDDRVRALLERTESLAREQLSSLHGTLRGLRTVPDGDWP